MIAGRLHSAVLTRHYCRQQTTQAHKCSSSSHYARSRNVACFSHRHSEAASTDLSPRSLSIITGGSRGLGAQIAECLIDSFTSTSARHPHNHLCTGHDVLLLASNQRILEGTLEKLRQHASKHDGVRLLGHAVNLGGMAQLEHELLRLCSSMHEGGILPQDPSLYHSVLLVNNAGQTGDLKFLWDQSLANIRDQMLLNVVSPTALTAAVTSTFMRSSSCQEITVVDIASVSCNKPYEAFGIYAAGKAARLMLTKTLALEADTFHNPRQDGGSSSGSSSSRSGPYIRAISYAPGALDTDMQAESREGLPQIPLKAAFTNNAQQGRLVEPRDSARRLVDALSAPRDEVPNGALLDYYTLVHQSLVQQQVGAGQPGAGAAGFKHPLDR